MASARLSLFVTLGAALLLLWHGPIAQNSDYHAFADTRSCVGLPNTADVLSNAGFAVVGLWGLLQLWPVRRRPAIAAGWPGYLLFLIALILTAAGSVFYHLAPDNDRLLWDRLPIALACAGLLVAVRAETRPNSNVRLWLLALSGAAVLSVLYWYLTERAGQGDLRPYLLLQGSPLVLIPLWQAMYGAPRADRTAFGIAILLYVVAKLAEVNDRELFTLVGVVSGHTLKHLLATAAASVVTWRLIERVGRTHWASASPI